MVGRSCLRNSQPRASERAYLQADAQDKQRWTKLRVRRVWRLAAIRWQEPGSNWLAQPQPSHRINQEMSQGRSAIYSNRRLELRHWETQLLRRYVPCVHREPLYVNFMLKHSVAFTHIYLIFFIYCNSNNETTLQIDNKLVCLLFFCMMRSSILLFVLLNKWEKVKTLYKHSHFYISPIFRIFNFNCELIVLLKIKSTPNCTVY